MPQAYVQVILGGDTMPQGMHEALQRTGAAVSFESISEVLRSGLKPTADAFVVIPSEDASAEGHGLQEVLARMAHQPRAALVVRPAGKGTTPGFPPTGAPVTFSENQGVEEMAARISTMIEMRPSLEKLARSRNGVRTADEKLAEMYEQQLRLAGKVQREFLPHVLPRFGEFSFSAIYRPREFVSGDIYDIRRVGENHVAIAVADVQGHGIGAALMTVFIKRALTGETRRGKLFRPLSPDEVLARLNEELMDAELSETQFVSVTYALLDLRRRRVEIARGGSPYPLWRHGDGKCEPLATPGFLVGVMREATFAVESIEMKPGDALVFYTDGLEQILLNQEQPTPHRRPASNESTPADQLITATDWYKHLRQAGVEPALGQINSRYDTLRRLGRALDDLTILSLRCG